jgi:hypothetical protein
MGNDRFDVSIRVPGPFEPKARYALQQLSLVLGIKVRLVDRNFPHPDAIYGDGTQRRSDCLWLPFDPDTYDPSIKHKSHGFDGTKVWGPISVARQAWDLVGATFRLLNLLDESQVPEEKRDDKGVFKVEALPEERRMVLAELLVENHADILGKRLAQQRQMPDEFIVPLWPKGKKWAFLISHDTDAITLGSPAEMCSNLLKGLMRRDRILLSMFKDGFSYLRRPSENPLFGFPGWCQVEAPGFRSCFYLFVKPKGLKRHLNDCKSTVVEQKIDWSILREMASSGWEFGLHAPIYAKQQVEAFTWGKEFIEEKIGQPVSGLRHHYWALDWRQPLLTFRKHAEAGFRYDASMAWRDSMGFRAGTSFPFQPFDTDRQAALPLYELPTCLMDRHLSDPPHPPSELVLERMATLFRDLKARHGVALLNWHTESACNRYRYLGDVDMLADILRQVVGDSEAWITTPRELSAWWSNRHQQLATSTAQ